MPFGPRGLSPSSSNRYGAIFRTGFAVCVEEMGDSWLTLFLKSSTFV